MTKTPLPQAGERTHITYTEFLKSEISETDFNALLEACKGKPAALNNLRGAASGSSSVRVFLADAAKLSGSPFRPAGYMWSWDYPPCPSATVGSGEQLRSIYPENQK